MTTHQTVVFVRYCTGFLFGSTVGMYIIGQPWIAAWVFVSALFGAYFLWRVKGGEG